MQPAYNNMYIVWKLRCPYRDGRNLPKRKQPSSRMGFPWNISPPVTSCPTLLHFGACLQNARAGLKGWKWGAAHRLNSTSWELKRIELHPAARRQAVKC